MAFNWLISNKKQWLKYLGTTFMDTQDHFLHVHQSGFDVHAKDTDEILKLSVS